MRIKNLVWPVLIIVCIFTTASWMYLSSVNKHAQSQLSNATKSESDNDKSKNEIGATLDLVKLAREIRPAVVLIETFDVKGAPMSRGSGFFVNEKGLLVTNCHVIKGASSFNIKAASGETYTTAAIKAINEKSDIACLLVSPIDKTPFIKMAELFPPVGQEIAVIGNPHGFESTVCKGTVSAIRKFEDFGLILQITAPISHGSSGSPVLNIHGEAVGIATFSETEGQALNFAVSFTKIMDIITEAGITNRETVIEFPDRAPPVTTPSTYNAELEAIQAELDATLAMLHDTYTLQLGTAERMRTDPRPIHLNYNIAVREARHRAQIAKIRAQAKQKANNHIVPTKRKSIIHGTVTGILYSEDKPMVAISTEILYEGDQIDGIKVVKIYEDRVEFEKGGKRWTQRIRETPNPAWQK